MNAESRSEQVIAALLSAGANPDYGGRTKFTPHQVTLPPEGSSALAHLRELRRAAGQQEELSTSGIVREALLVFLPEEIRKHTNTSA